MKKLPAYILKTVEAYRATGRLAFVHPRKGTISLNGHAEVSYDVAYRYMRECLDQTTCPRCGSTQHDAMECVGLS